jgi:hypothetical protein
MPITKFAQVFERQQKCEFFFKSAVFCGGKYPQHVERLFCLIYSWMGLSYLPVRKTGMETKKPPTAQTRVTDDFCRYLFVLKANQRRASANVSRQKKCNCQFTNWCTTIIAMNHKLASCCYIAIGRRVISAVVAK